MRLKGLPPRVFVALVATAMLIPYSVLSAGAANLFTAKAAAPQAISPKAEVQSKTPVPPDIHSDYRVIPNIIFAPDRGLAGDFYLPNPSSGSKHPAIITVHGGAWHIGARSSPGDIEIAKRLASHGYVVFSVDYRLIQNGGLYPNPIKDINDAFGYLVVNAEKWGVDEKRIGIFGGSVGGTLAMLSAYAPHSGAFAPLIYKDVPQKIKVLVAFAPLTDIRNTELPWVMKWMDDTPWHTPKIYAEASPITYAASAVPTLCIHGTKDSTVDFEQSVRLVKALRAKGVEARLVPLEGAKHIPLYQDSAETRDKAFSELIRFFDEKL